MAVTVVATWERAALHSILAMTRRSGMDAAIARACSKAGTTAIRDMRSEAKKRIRARKALKAGTVAKSLRLRKPSGLRVDSEWGVDVSGAPVKLVEYPHRVLPPKETQGRDRKGRFRALAEGPGRQGGVSVEVNRGKRTILREAFIAKLKSGHEGIFRRVSKASLPIQELIGSRPVDALLHAGEAEGVAARGRASFSSTFQRLLPLEVGKIK